MVFLPVLKIEQLFYLELQFVCLHIEQKLDEVDLR